MLHSLHHPFFSTLPSTLKSPKRHLLADIGIRNLFLLTSCMCGTLSCHLILFDGMIWYGIFVNCNWVVNGGRSTVHIYTQTIHRTIQNKQYIEQHKDFGSVRAVPRLGELYPGICLTTEEKARKNLRQGSQTIRIHTPNSKNT